MHYPPGPLRRMQGGRAPNPVSPPPAAQAPPARQPPPPPPPGPRASRARAPPIAVGVPVASVADSRDLVKGGQLIARWDAQTQATQVAFSPDGQTYATALADGTIQLWPSNAGKLLRTLCLSDDSAPSVVGL